MQLQSVKETSAKQHLIKTVNLSDLSKPGHILYSTPAPLHSWG